MLGSAPHAPHGGRLAPTQAKSIREALRALGISIVLLVLVRFPFFIALPVALSAIPFIYRAVKRQDYIDETFRLDEEANTKVGAPRLRYPPRWRPRRRPRGQCTDWHAHWRRTDWHAHWTLIGMRIGGALIGMRIGH